MTIDHASSFFTDVFIYFLQVHWPLMSRETKTYKTHICHEKQWWIATLGMLCLSHFPQHWGQNDWQLHVLKGWVYLDSQFEKFQCMFSRFNHINNMVEEPVQGQLRTSWHQGRGGEARIQEERYPLPGPAPTELPLPRTHCLLRVHELFCLSNPWDPFCKHRRLWETVLV